MGIGGPTQAQKTPPGMGGGVVIDGTEGGIPIRFIRLTYFLSLNSTDSGTNQHVDLD